MQVVQLQRCTNIYGNVHCIGGALVIAQYNEVSSISNRTKCFGTASAQPVVPGKLLTS